MEFKTKFFFILNSIYLLLRLCARKLFLLSGIFLIKGPNWVPISFLNGCRSIAPVRRTASRGRFTQIKSKTCAGRTIRFLAECRHPIGVFWSHWPKQPSFCPSTLFHNGPDKEIRVFIDNYVFERMGWQS